VTAPRPWLGISARGWFINSDTPQKDLSRELDRFIDHGLAPA
jgi:hypothetical protein